MSMSNIHHSSTDFHYSFKRFSKLVHLPAILRRSNVLKTKGVSDFAGMTFKYSFSAVLHLSGVTC